MIVGIDKGISFLDLMVKIVFASTFIFTGIVLAFILKMGWEQALVTLIERWFTVMVGELIVMGAIQITKSVIQAKVEREGLNGQNQLEAEIE